MKQADVGIRVLDEAVSEGAQSMAKSFEYYWPTAGNTGAHERNASLHVGAALIRRQFSVFGEGHSQESGADRRFDLLGYSPTERIFVAAEFKQLWTPNVASGMQEDVKRLQEFRPIGRVPVDPCNVFGVVGALVEGGPLLLQLLGLPSPGRHRAVEELLAAAGPTVAWKSVQLSRKHGRHPDRTGSFHFVWAAFPVGEHPTRAQ